jgi:hypothetical protein
MAQTLKNRIAKLIKELKIPFAILVLIVISLIMISSDDHIMSRAIQRVTGETVTVSKPLLISSRK